MAIKMHHNAEHGWLVCDGCKARRDQGDKPNLAPVLHTTTKTTVERNLLVCDDCGDCR